MVNPSSVTDRLASPEKLLARLWLHGDCLWIDPDRATELAMIGIVATLYCRWGWLWAGCGLASGGTVATPFIVVCVFTVVYQLFLRGFLVFLIVCDCFYRVLCCFLCCF